MHQVSLYFFLQMLSLTTYMIFVSAQESLTLATG